MYKELILIKNEESIEVATSEGRVQLALNGSSTFEAYDTISDYLSVDQTNWLIKALQEAIDEINRHATS